MTRRLRPFDDDPPDYQPEPPPLSDAWDALRPRLAKILIAAAAVALLVAAWPFLIG